MPQIRIKGLLKFIVTQSILLVVGQIIVIAAGVYFTQSLLHEIWLKKFESQSEILANALSDEISDRAMLLRQWSHTNLHMHTSAETVKNSGELFRLFDSNLQLYTFSYGARTAKKTPKIVQVGLSRPDSVYVEPINGENKKFGFVLCSPHTKSHVHCVYAEAKLQLQTYAIRDHFLRSFRVDLVDQRGHMLTEFFPFNAPFGNTPADYDLAILKTIPTEAPREINVNDYNVFSITRAIAETDYSVIVLAPVAIFKADTTAQKRFYYSILLLISVVVFLINTEFFRRKILIPTIELKKFEKLIADELKIATPQMVAKDEINMLRDFFETLYSNIQVFKKKQESFQGELKNEIDFLERDKAKMTRQLIQSEKISVINRLMSGVAHEIKNPLASIKLSIDNLKLTEKNLSQESNKKLNVISEEVIRLSSVLNRFLSIGKMNGQELKFKKININDLIAHTIKLMQPSFEEKKSTIQMELDPSTVEQDFVVDEISSALINLLRNSLEAIEPRGVVRITTKKMDNLTYVTVEDSGMGIPVENFHKIFDVFFTTKPSGTGLGMPQVLQAVTIHSGEIDVSKSPLGGACIRISFPIAGGHT